MTISDRNSRNFWVPLRNKLYRYPEAFIFACLVAWNMLGSPNALVPVAIIIVSLYIFLKFIAKGATVDVNVVIFLLYLPLELLVVHPDDRFHSWERYGLFLTMMMIVSPLLQSSYSREFRLTTLQFFLLIIVIASIGSFFAYLMGINMMSRFGTNEYIGMAGRFGGLFNHSMLLGPMASLSTLFLFYKGLTTRRKWFYLLTALSGCAVLFSASRGSFIGLVVAALFLIYRYSRNKRHFLKICFSAVVLLALTYPIWQDAMSGLEQKQSANIEMGSTLKSRGEKWNNRWEEFVSNPVFGVGFCAINPDSSEFWNHQTGTVEPGSSWLAILSMTGLLGLLLFLWIYCRGFIATLTSAQGRGILLSTFLVFFSIHLISEGYVFATGSPLCILFWLVLGCCCDMRYYTLRND